MNSNSKNMTLSSKIKCMLFDRNVIYVILFSGIETSIKFIIKSVLNVIYISVMESFQNKLYAADGSKG